MQPFDYVLEEGRLQRGRPIESLVKEMWPTGATDGLFVRNVGIPVYGVSTTFEGINDGRAHGCDERVGVEEFRRASTFWYRMLKALTSSGAT